MSRRIRQGLSEAGDRTFQRVLVFFAALGVGGLLGWWIFSIPIDSASPTPTPAEAQPASRPAATKIPVQETGEPAQGLGGSVQVGRPAPDFTLPGLDGGDYTLSDFQGQVILVNFWTTWCPPCRVEMPALQAAYESLREEGFVVLAVNWTQIDDRDQVAPFVDELGLTFPILLDSQGEVSEDLYHLVGLPTSVFVARDGTVSEVYIGALDLDRLEVRIRFLLGASQ